MIDLLEQRVHDIEIRNARVEMDKAWEGSKTRKICVAVLTYLILTLFMAILGVENPLLSALIPTGGFLLSTLSLHAVKDYWLKYNKTP